MLRKFISIKNVGRFQSYGASGDVDLKRHTLFFAENGRGKTTLCALLRSLQTGDPAYVLGRTTLGATEPVEINIRSDAGNAVFSKNSWSATEPDLAIFDSTFISENVYAGDAIDLDHKRNLYRIIIGKEGVDLALQVDQLDADIKAKTAEIKDHRSAVQLCAPRGITVDVFLTLPEDREVDAKILEKKRELESVRQADQIRMRSALTSVTLPSVSTAIETLLDTTVEGLAADAERRVSEHIAAHGMKERGEGWLSEGRGYIRKDACPFCGQGIDTVPLIEAYRTYFSAAYDELRHHIRELRSGIEASLSDRAIAQAEKAIDSNEAGTEFWTRHCEIVPPTLSATSVGDIVRAQRQAALNLLDRKIMAPLDRIAPDRPYTEALKATAAFGLQLASYNEAVRAANAIIATKKATIGALDVKALEADILRLEAIKARHQQEAREACDAHDATVTAKRTLEADKTTARKKLDEHTATVVGRYEKTINTLLDDFQVGFRITQTKHDYRGGVPASSFQIVINDTAIDLGDGSTPLDTPSFRNTLSSGDKSTLALALFLSQIEQDPDKARKIVVFDDPFNSQDAFRKDHTVAKIKKCGESCTQVILLSHDRSFLKRIWDRLEPADRKGLRLARLGVRNTAITEWDIEKDTQDRFKADLKALADYYSAGEGSPRDIVKKIRPVLETYCRLLYPSQFAETEMLGGIIGKVRTAGVTHPLAAVVDDLENLNEYTKRYHHGESKNAATEPIDDTELQGFVKKTLLITGGC